MIDERKLTGGEKRSKEAKFKKLKKNKDDFKKRYGKDAESVMHAVATKQAKNEDAEYKPHMMYKGKKSDYRAFKPAEKDHHDRLMRSGYDHDNPETKKIEEKGKKGTFKTDPKLKNLRLIDIPSYYERMKQGYVQNKNEDIQNDLPTTNQRTQRMLNLIRANNPTAKNDFEAILLSLAKAKKNLSNDEDQADIAALRKDVDGLKLLVNQMKGKVDGLNESATLITEEEFDMLAEKKDACYHKVKSRYKVWPSAYASGALVQCRKKGAANWGNSKKKK